MFKKGDEVTFFGVNEDFEDIGELDWFINNRHYYKVDSFDLYTMVVKTEYEEKFITVENALDDYQIFTKEMLSNHLKSLNSQHLAICNKIKQLYRKHNKSNSTFKWQGV